MDAPSHSPSLSENDSFSDLEDERQSSEATPLLMRPSKSRTTRSDIFRPSSNHGPSIEHWLVMSNNTKTLGPTWSSSEDDRSLYSTTKSIASQSLRSLATASLENFREGLAIPFTDDEGSARTIRRGLGALSVVGTIIGLVMPKNQYLDGQWYPWYRVISSVIGYNYFVLWSICFYPQVLLNYRRQSTKGLSQDFAVLNFMGWSFYSAYLIAMYFDDRIKTMYAERFQNESSTVQSNDVAFAVHAMILSFLYIVQIVYYGGSMRLKPTTWFLVLAMGIPSAGVPFLIQFGYLPYSAWLDYFYALSFFKICCTLTKYSKQVVLNYTRKSTKGWNIWYNFLECTGGSLSMIQIVFDSIDMQDITGITGNIAKLALGVATLFFDAIFFTQHYILYAPKKQQPQQIRELPDGVPRMIKTPSMVRSTTTTQLAPSKSHSSALDVELESV